MKKIAIGVGSFIVVAGIVAGVVIAPVVSANTYAENTKKSSQEAIEKVKVANTAIEQLVVTSQAPNALSTQAAIDQYRGELARVLRIQREAKEALDKGKEEISRVGGVKLIDLTGAYDNAEDSAETLGQAYGELSSAYDRFVLSADAVTDAMESLFRLNEVLMSEDMSRLSEVTTQLEKDIVPMEAYVEAGYATAAEKDTIVLIKEVAGVFRVFAAAYENQDVAALMQVSSDLDALMPRFDAVQDKLNQESDAQLLTIKTQTTRIKDTLANL